MKHNSVWGKILLLVMSVVLALSCLVACNDEEIGKLEETTVAIDADLTELKALVSQIKTTADAAATAVKLNEVAAKLEAVSAKADAAATAEALAAAKADLKALVDTTKADLKALTETNKTGLAAANTAIDAAEAKIAAIEAKIAALEDADFAAEIAGIKAAALALEESLETEIETLNQKYTDLKASVDAKANASDVEEIANNVATLQAALDLAKEDIQALKNAPDFAKNYQFATAVLYGDELVEGVEYSIDAFENLVKTVKASDYAQPDYEEFSELVERLHFFLGRAISVDAIIDCFEKLQAAIDEMPTLLESLQKAVDAIEVVTAEADCLDSVTGIYTKIENLNNDGEADNDIEVGAELLADYNLIVAAHDNLVAAAGATAEAVDAINAIGKVVYIDSADEIAAAGEAIENYVTFYFANDDYNAFYEVDETDLIANYDVYDDGDDETATDAVSRYAQLVAANTGKVVITATALDYDNNRPLWSEKAEYDADKAEYAAWLVEYAIDETDDAASIANIYGTELEYLAKASAYADAMTLVYTDTEFAENIKGVEALNAAIDALLDNNADLVLWTEMVNAEEIRDFMDALKAEVEDVVDFDAAKDVNFATMLTANRTDAFDAMYERMEELDLANDELDDLYDYYTETIGEVDFGDFEAIKDLEAEVEAVYIKYSIDIDDANYVAFASEKDVNKLIVDLNTAYADKTQLVSDIYYEVIPFLNPEADMPLVFGKELAGYRTRIMEIFSYGVTDVNLPLGEAVNLDDLFEKFELVVAKYNEKAEKAALAAETVNAAIENMPTADTLNNYDAIVAVYDELYDWIEAYLAADLALVDNNVADALAAIAGVQIFNSTENYEFVTGDSYDKCVGAHDAVVDLRAAAEDAWTTLKPELEYFVNNTWDIHDLAKFEAILDMWEGDGAEEIGFLATYYGTSIDGADEFETELKNTYNAFNTEYELCKTRYAEAETKIGEIEGAIGNLLEITPENAKEKLEAIYGTDGIMDLIDKYVAEYCPNAINEGVDQDGNPLWCEHCLNRTLFIQLHVKGALAELYDYANQTKLKANNEQISAKIDEVLTAWSSGLSDLADKESTTTEWINNTLNGLKSRVKAQAPCCVPDAAIDADHIDADEDCLCDACGTVTHNIVDCECTKCQTTFHVGTDDDCICDTCNTAFHVGYEADCKCDNCSSIVDGYHVNDAGDDCKCDVCGTVMPGEHVDEYNSLAMPGSDGICEICGEPC